MPVKKYLITGVAGFIGSALARYLLTSGYEVVGVDDLSTGFVSNVPDGCEFIRGDCADDTIISNINASNIEAIFHLAGQSSGEISFSDPVKDIRANTVSTLLLLQFAEKNKIDKFIYASTMSVYGEPEEPNLAVRECDSVRPKSFYGVGKLASEHYLKIYKDRGMQTFALRFFNVYGPGQNMENTRQGMVSIYLAHILSFSKVEVKGSKTRYRDFIYIDDVVEALIRCLTINTDFNGVINIGTGIATTVEELLDHIQSLYGKPIKLVFGQGTPGDIHGIHADTTVMDEILGSWRKVELKSGLRLFLQALGQN